MYDKIEAYFQGDLNGKTIGVWGLAFKPNTDDIREAPALYNIDLLLEKGARVIVFDPEASENVKQIYGDKLTYCKEQYEAVMDVDALAIMTEWAVFRNPSFDLMKKLMKERVIFDGRNLYDLDQMRKLGFFYDSIGRGRVERLEKA